MRFQVWLFVPGNNDLIDEDPKSLAHYNGFIAELTTKLGNAGIKVVNLCPQAGDAKSGIYVFDAPPGDVAKWIGDRGVGGPPYEYSAWTVQDDVRKE